MLLKYSPSRHFKGGITNQSLKNGFFKNMKIKIQKFSKGKINSLISVQRFDRNIPTFEKYTKHLFLCPLKRTERFLSRDVF